MGKTNGGPKAAPKTRRAADPAAPALAAVKRAETALERALTNRDKTRRSVDKAEQSLQTAKDAHARTEAEVRAAEQVLAHAKAHPLLAGPTLDDEPTDDVPDPVVTEVAAGTGG